MYSIHLTIKDLFFHTGSTASFIRYKYGTRKKTKKNINILNKSWHIKEEETHFLCSLSNGLVFNIILNVCFFFT